MKAPKRTSPAKEIPFPYHDPNRKRHVPGRHEVTHAQARRMRKAALALFGEDGLGRPGAYHREIFDKILGDARCVGIRMYPGVDETGCVTILFCGIDSKGNNILVGTIGDFPYRCPPFCPSKDGILAF